MSKMSPKTRAVRNPLVLYSANTLLACEFNDDYYGGNHFVFCSPSFNPWAEKVDNAQSSNPCELYHNFRAVAKSNDVNSPYIDRNKLGLRHGIDAKYKTGVISDAERTALIRRVRDAQPRDFAPRLFVIPFSPVAKLVKELPLGGRGVRSKEYLVEALPRRLFDMVELERTNPL